MNFKVLLCDDDPGMRMLLRKTVEKIEGFEIVGEVGDGETACLLVEKLRPQVVFIDVEMPKLDGIECAKRISDIDPKTIIIFATGHSEFMTEAFQLYAFDYIVKPFKIERVHKTLERIKSIHKNEDKPIKNIIHSEQVLNKLLIKNKEGISFVDISQIVIIQREDRSTVIYTSDNSYITSEGLRELEEKLDGNQFFRSHKSYIINLTMIYKIYPYGRWTYIVKLKDSDKDALITHEKYEELKKIFGI